VYTVSNKCTNKFCKETVLHYVSKKRDYIFDDELN